MGHIASGFKRRGGAIGNPGLFGNHSETVVFKVLCFRISKGCHSRGVHNHSFKSAISYNLFAMTM